MRNTELLKKKSTPTLQPLSHRNWQKRKSGEIRTQILKDFDLLSIWNLNCWSSVAMHVFKASQTKSTIMVWDVSISFCGVPMLPIMFLLFVDRDLYLHSQLQSSQYCNDSYSSMLLLLFIPHFCELVHIKFHSSWRSFTYSTCPNTCSLSTTELGNSQKLGKFLVPKSFCQNNKKIHPLPI